MTTITITKPCFNTSPTYNLYCRLPTGHEGPHKAYDHLLSQLNTRVEYQWSHNTMRPVNDYIV
jgi:hypothetical protein